MELAQRFRELRQGAGLTGRSLAVPRYNPSYVSQIEAGRRQPSAEALQFFAQRLGVSPRYLATGVPDGVESRLQYGIEHARELLRQGEPMEAERQLEKVLAQVQEYGLPRLQAQTLTVLGDALRQKGEHRRAIDAYEQAAAGPLTRREKGAAVGGLARALLAFGDLNYGLEVVDAYLKDQDDEAGDATVLTDLQSVLVSIYFERGEMVRAERAARRALASAGPDVPLPVRAVAYWHASRVVAELKQWDEALELATRARVLMEESEDRRRVGRLHNAYAFLCLEADPPRTREAKVHLDSAERMLTEASGDDRAQVHTERSRLALMEERPAEALDHATLALAEVTSDRLEFARCLFLKGRALAALGRGPEATQTLQKAAGLFANRGARQQEAACWRELGELHLARSDLDGAIFALRAGLEALDPRRWGGGGARNPQAVVVRARHGVTERLSRPEGRHVPGRHAERSIGPDVPGGPPGAGLAVKGPEPRQDDLLSSHDGSGDALHERVDHQGDVACRHLGLRSDLFHQLALVHVDAPPLSRAAATSTIRSWIVASSPSSDALESPRPT
jgi:tetratricopeptide (TPR) repeat protein